MVEKNIEKVNNIIFESIKHIDEDGNEYWLGRELQKALKEGKNIDSTEQLNAVLPDDINVILQEQYEYMLRNNIT